MPLIFRSLLVVVGLYVAYAALFFLIQRAVLYPGTRLGPGLSWPGASGGVVDADAIGLRAAGLSIDALYVPGNGSARVRPAAIVFHGNAELAVDLVRPFAPLADLGVSALFVEYPGFGGQAGRPTETSIMETATAAHDWLAARPDVDPSRIIALGRSLGTGPAAGLASRRELRALVLWSPFVSVGYLALRKYGLPPFLARDRFDTRGAVRDYEGPVLIFHGTRDRVIPYGNAEVLAGVNGGAELVDWACAHNDCPPTWPELWDPLSRFLIAADVVEPPIESEGGRTADVRTEGG